MFSKKESAMIDTLDDFINRVETLSDISNAYDVFEYECTDKLRDYIYGFADTGVAEPFREAMHNLGFDTY